MFRLLVVGAVVTVVVTACGASSPGTNDESTVVESTTTVISDTTMTDPPATTVAFTTTATEPSTTSELPTTTTEPTSTSTNPTDLQSITVAFTIGGGGCDEVVRFEREISEFRDPILGAFESLVAGPIDRETLSGAASFFSADTAGTVASVALSGGLLTVDFADLTAVIPNASTSCGSMALLGQLNTTAFQFGDVERVRYEIEGSCDTFANWLQRECTNYTRN